MSSDVLNYAAIVLMFLVLLMLLLLLMMMMMIMIMIMMMAGMVMRIKFVSMLAQL